MAYKYTEVYINIAIFVLAVLIFPITLVLATVYSSYYAIILGVGLVIDFIFFVTWYLHLRLIPNEPPMVYTEPAVKVSLHSDNQV